MAATPESFRMKGFHGGEQHQRRSDAWRISSRARSPSLSHIERQSVLEQNDARTRLQFINQQLAREVELLELRQKIQSQVQGQLSQSQREFYLREQLKAIQKELGEGDEGEQETEELRERIEKAGMPDEVKQETLKELGRFARINPMSPEHTVARTYLEWLISLPWSVSSGEAVNVQRAAEILDEDHYDLEKVKNRILDFLAVMQLKPRLKGPILCFVGPPGVGKTSLGRSIARSLGRKFQRISLGGMHDEAEIRGHRRTYIGSMPGQVMQALRRAGRERSQVFVLVTRWINSDAISAGTRLRRCSKCSIRNRTRPSAITIWMCRSISRGFCSLRRRMCSIRFPGRCSIVWRLSSCRVIRNRRR